MGLGFLCRRLLAPIKSASHSVQIGQQQPRSRAPLFGFAAGFTSGGPKHGESMVRNVIPDFPIYEKWIIVMEFPENVPDTDMLGAFVRTAAKVLKSSEEEAKAKIYKTETKMYHGFHIETSKEMAKKFTEESEVAQVIPDSFGPY